MAKILVVDDVPDNVKLLAYELSDHGHEVLTAIDGLQALEVAGSERPDVILLDIMMPGIDGIEVCRRLKADAGLRSVPVILISALERQDDVVRGLDAGAHDYITKPFNDRIVLARVRSALREKTAYDTIAEMNVQLEHRLQRIAALRRIDRAIAASLDLRVTLETLLDEVMAQLGVHAAAVLRLDPHTHIMAYAAGRGFRTPDITRARLRLGEGHIGRAALERRPVYIPDLAVAGETSLRVPLMEGEAFVAYYAVPLVAKGQVLGVLEIYHRSALELDPEWLDFLEALAGQAAIAVDNATLFDHLQGANIELTLAYDATIEGWSRALDLRDKETEGHSRRVTELTLRLARTMGMREAELVHVRRGALLHDVGKLGIPDSILFKPDPLTEAEREVMQRHATYAYEWLEPIAFLRPALEIPYCHHEKWDGTGYPCGLKGEQIPLAARIFAVVDIWDALRSDRPYRKSWPETKVLEHIASLAGTHLDPKVVRAFLATVAVPPTRDGSDPGHPIPINGADATMWGMFEAAFDYVLLLDETHRILAASTRFAAIITPGCDPRGSDFIESLDTVSQDRTRAALASLPDIPDQSQTLVLGHRTSSGAIHQVRYAFCKMSRPEGPRVVALGRNHEESLKLVNQIAQLERELEQTRRDLTEQALSDSLTGLGNRRWLLDRLDSLWATAGRQRDLLWLMMVDLDHFKAINDTFGHQVGDEALVTVARAMREAVRTEDVVARYGGEEFVLAGLCRNESEPLDLAARLVEEIRHLQVELPDRTLRLTASLGLTLVQPGHLSPPWITLKVADRALYRAKAAGRDRYVVEPGVLGTGGKGVAALCVSEGHMTTEGMR